MPTKDSTPSAALITGTAILRPAIALLKLLEDARILNQAAYLYFHLRQILPANQTIQTIAPSTVNTELTPGEFLSILCQLYDAGLIKNFAIAIQFDWIIDTPAPMNADELRSLYFKSGAMKSSEYVKAALATSYQNSSTWTDFNIDTFSEAWILALKDAAFWLRDMEKRGTIAMRIPTNSITIYWHPSPPGPDLNLNELKKMRELKLINERGYIFFGIKSIAPNGGIINFTQLEQTWAINSNAVFEELAKYQSRDFINLYLEQLTIEWLEIPVFIAKDKLLKRRGMYREHGFLYHALRTDNPTGEQMQAIRLSRVQMDWEIDMADSIKYLKRLTGLGLVRADLSQASLTWRI